MKSIKSLKNIIIIGSPKLLKEIFEQTKNLNFKFYLISSPDQIKDVRIKSNFDKIVLSKFNNKKIISFFKKNNINKTNSIFISYSSRFLFKDDHIKKVFFNNLFNIHCSRLPYDQGGGGVSWRIMQNDRIGNLCIHKIEDSKIDKGKIYKYESYVINKKLITPKEIINDIEKRLPVFVLDFLKEIRSKNKVMTFNTPEYLGSYFPRIFTPVSSWINWDDDSVDLINFINAFDTPYTGAQSSINSKKIKKVRIKSAQLSCSDFNSNKLMKGIIYRHNKNWINVSLDDKYSLIIEDIKDFKNNNVMGYLKEGDQFFSEPKNLIKRVSKRIVFGPSGKK